MYGSQDPLVQNWRCRSKCQAGIGNPRRKTDLPRRHGDQAIFKFVADGLINFGFSTGAHSFGGVQCAMSRSRSLHSRYRTCSAQKAKV